MVAALFEGDLRYALTVFGKPKGLDAVIAPDGYALPPTLTLRAIVDIDFVMEPDAELFRVYRLEDDQGLTFFSLQTFARSLDSSRPGPFIGAGIFARAGVDPVAMVKALRDLLRAAQLALTANHCFTVDEISDNEKRLLVIPSSVDAVRAAQSPWIPYVQLESRKKCFVKASKAGANTPEQFFQAVLSLPFAFSRNSFYSDNQALIASCRARANDFDVMPLEDVYARVERHTHHALVERAQCQQQLVDLKKQHQRDFSEHVAQSTIQERTLNDQIRTLREQTRVLERNVVQFAQMPPPDFGYLPPNRGFPSDGQAPQRGTPRAGHRKSRIWLLCWLLAVVAAMATGINFGPRVLTSICKTPTVTASTRGTSQYAGNAPTPQIAATTDKDKSRDAYSA